MTVASKAIIVIFYMQVGEGGAVTALRKFSDTSGNMTCTIYHKRHVVCVPARAHGNIFRNDTLIEHK